MPFDEVSVAVPSALNTTSTVAVAGADWLIGTATAKATAPTARLARMRFMRTPWL